MLSATFWRGRGALARMFRPVRRIRHNEDGVTAVEFAMVAVPFFAFIFVIIEITAVYFGTFALENAVDQTARMIRTGQAQSQGMTKSQFVTTVCGKVSMFSDCLSALQVDVRSSPTFAGMAPPTALDGDGDLDPSGLNSWDLGNGGNVVLVTVFYKWGLIGQIPGIGLSNQTDGSRLLSAMAAFRNEPFDG